MKKSKKTLSFLLAASLALISVCTPVSADLEAVEDAGASEIQEVYDDAVSVILSGEELAGASVSEAQTNVINSITAVGRYSNWDGVTNAAQFKGADGYLYFAVDGSGSVTVYKTNGTSVVGTVTLTKQHPTFGTVICDSSGNFYLVTGETNSGSDTTTETVFISKYDKYGNHIKTVGDNGDSSLAYYYNSTYYTKIPFDGGNCDAAISCNILAVNYAREMYSGHQSNSIFAVNINDMSQVSLGSWYESHSFAQRAVALSSGFVFASEGDCYDRAYTLYTVKTSGDKLASSGEYGVFHFWVAQGNANNMSVINNNYAHMGGLAALSDSRVAFAAASARSMDSAASSEREDIFIQIFDPSKNLTTAAAYYTTGTRSGLTGREGTTSATNYGVKWLTSFASGERADNVQIAATDDNRFVVLYEYYSSSSFKGVYYMVLDQNGNIKTGPSRFSETARLDPCESPIFSNGRVSWIGNKYGDSSKYIYLYLLDPDADYSSVKKDFSVSSVADQTYTGLAIAPAVTVTDGTKTLTSGTDYTLSYSNNTNVGTATITITGIGDYAGTKTLNFRINAKSVSGFTLSSIAAQTYTGSALTPSLTVKDGTKTLTNGTDYSLSYSNNTNAGTATVTLTGKGNYTGTRSTTFTISAKAVSALTVSSIADQTYTDSAITPAVTVKDGTKTLTKGTDYTLSYSNNTNVGTATVTITGKGNYTGTKKVTFAITEKITPPTLAAIGGEKSVTLKWTKVTGATKYGIYKYANGKYTKISTEVTGTSYVVTGLDDDTEYTFFVQAYTTKWIQGGNESYATARTDAGAVYPTVTAKGGDKSVTLTWTAVPGATKYGVYKYANGKYTKVSTEVTGTSYTVTGLAEDTEYTFFVQAYKEKWLAGGDESYATAKTNAGITYTTVTAKGGDKSVTLTWTKVNGATKYGVYRYANGKYTKVNLEVTGTSYTVTGLAEDTEYTFFVQAYKNSKWYAGTNDSYATAKTNAGITYPILTATGGSKSVTLSWTAVKGATKYGVYRYDAATNKYTKIDLGVTGTSYTVTGLAAKTQYTFFVQAYTTKWLAGADESYATAETILLS